MAAADYRLMTEATGQRIAAALEALSGTGAAAAAARTNLDVYSKDETDAAIAQSTACKIVTGTTSVAVPNSGTVAADFTGLVPSGYRVRGGLFMMGGYNLPYLNGGTYTFVRTITAEGVVTIDNTASGWGTQTVAAVLFLVKR